MGLFTPGPSHPGGYALRRVFPPPALSIHIGLGEVVAPAASLLSGCASFALLRFVGLCRGLSTLGPFLPGSSGESLFRSPKVRRVTRGVASLAPPCRGGPATGPQGRRADSAGGFPRSCPLASERRDSAILFRRRHPHPTLVYRRARTQGFRAFSSAILRLQFIFTPHFGLLNSGPLFSSSFFPLRLLDL